jgi:hypothetical protein
MKHILLTFYLAFIFFHFKLYSQEDTIKYSPQIKSSSVYINEIYLYKEGVDTFKYKKKKRIIEWIEILNGTSKAVNVAGLFFTDDLNDPYKWPLKPIKRKDRKIKRGRILLVYIHATGKRNKISINYVSEEKCLFLIRQDKGSTVILDTLRLPPDKRYPYSRYPAGSGFTNTDVLTMGTENVVFKSSESKRSLGFTTHIGIANSTSEEFQNSSHPILAGAAGLYYRSHSPNFYFERGVRFAMRGYHIAKTLDQQTTQGLRKIKISGRQTIYHLDFPLYAGIRLSKNISFFGGPEISFKVKSVLSYETQSVITNFSNGQQIKTKATYYSAEKNDALDNIDFTMVTGLRYFWKEKINISLYYVRDFGGVNFGAIDMKATQINSGLYFAVSSPLLQSKKRVNRRSAFTR